ncbi:MAG: flagellar basal body rod protein FlgC [Gammaproteobacteria bacterium]|jgi:flagellar basal-body rod protein FlgC
MDYLASFDISASGMAVEKMRLDVMALNLANANSTRVNGGGIYKPLKVISAATTASFDSEMVKQGFADIAGAQIVDIRPVDTEPRLVFDPNHPDANEKGYVSYPNVNPVSEMVTLIEATRAYEANVKAMNAAKSMALRALEIGSSR